MAFYIEYLTKWWGPLLIFSLALILSEITRQFLRRIFPRSYTLQTARDGMVIELHHAVSLLVGLLAFFAGTAPLLFVLIEMPTTPFHIVLSIAFAFSGVLIFVLVLGMIKHVKVLHRMRKKEAYKDH